MSLRDRRTSSVKFILNEKQEFASIPLQIPVLFLFESLFFKAIHSPGIFPEPLPPQTPPESGPADICSSRSGPKPGQLPGSAYLPQYRNQPDQLQMCRSAPAVMRTTMCCQCTARLLSPIISGSIRTLTRRRSSRPGGESMCRWQTTLRLRGGR